MEMEALEPMAVNTSEDPAKSYAAMMENANWPRESGANLADEEAAEQVTAVPPDPVRIIEALLFVGGMPLTAEKACEIIRGLTPEQFTQAIDKLNQDYRRQGRPYTLQAQDQGYLLTLRPRYQGVVEKVYGGPREARLSTAVIDVLALVAYRQPATKAEIDSLRGAESGSLLRQLVRRGLVQVVYQEEEKSKSASPAAQEKKEKKQDREVRYTTSPRFLEFFGLSSLEDLPHTQDLQQM